MKIELRAAACDLLALDLDGTLLNSRGAISQRNAEAIARAEAAGIAVIVATGRSWMESRHVLAPLNYAREMIAAGGSVLADGASGRTIERTGLPGTLVRDVLASVLRHGHPALLLKDLPGELDQYVVVGDGDLDPASEWWFREFGVGHHRVSTAHDDPHPEDTVRIGLVSSGRHLAEIVDELRAEIGERVFCQHWSAVTSAEAIGSATHLLEVFHPAVSKWTAVERLCARSGIDPARTVAVGDGLNDVEMLRAAGLGIAMANAGSEAKAAADMVFEVDHNHDGVAEIIEALLAR